MENTELVLVERRKYPRHLIEVQISVLFPEYYHTGEEGYWGWTKNISAEGVCFSLQEKLTSRELVLHIDYEGMGAEYVLADVIDEPKPEEEGWTYRCKIVRILASIGALACLEG